MRTIAVYALAIYVAVAIGLLIDPPRSVAFERLLLGLAFVPLAAAAVWLKWDWAPRVRRENRRREKLKAPDQPAEDA